MIQMRRVSLSITHGIPFGVERPTLGMPCSHHQLLNDCINVCQRLVEKTLPGIHLSKWLLNKRYLYTLPIMEYMSGVYLWNWCKYAGGRTAPGDKCGYRNAAKLAASNGFLILKPKWLNGFGDSDVVTEADGICAPLGKYGLYGWPDGPTFSCLRHFARRFWNHTCKENSIETLRIDSNVFVIAAASISRFERLSY